MTQNVFRGLQPLFLSFLLLASTVLTTENAFGSGFVGVPVGDVAAAVAADADAGPGSAVGCDPKVMDAMNAAAQARVAYDVAMVDEIMGMAECSVIKLSGFEEGATFEARNARFSGSFEVAPFIAGPILELTRSLGINADCSSLSVRMDQVRFEGITEGIANPDFQELINGTLPAGAGPLYTDGVNAAAGQMVFSHAQEKIDLLPGLDVRDCSAAGAEGSCAVMVCEGAFEGPCPE